MDDLKIRAGEKIGALHDAALGAANTSKDKLNDAVQQSVDAIRKLRAVLMELWQHELVSEARARAWWWVGEAARRVREGAPPLSPVVLYRDLVDLLKDRVWRRTIVIFLCGAALGGGAGLLVGLRAGTRAPAGPTSRALHTQSDQTVILVEDAVSPGACTGEVLVRVQAFSVCWSDRAVLRGRGASLRALLAAPPVTVGRGFAGVILDVGPGVTDLELGDEVWGVVSEWGGGAASELLAIRRSRVCRRPRALSPTHAAALPWAGARALKALQALGDAAGGGARVLLVGGQSGAACLLVQLLSARGVRVCVAEPSQTHATMKELGAHEVIDLPQSWSLPPGGWDALVVGDGAPGDPPRKLLRTINKSANKESRHIPSANPNSCNKSPKLIVRYYSVRVVAVPAACRAWCRCVRARCGRTRCPPRCGPSATSPSTGTGCSGGWRAWAGTRTGWRSLHCPRSTCCGTWWRRDNWRPCSIRCTSLTTSRRRWRTRAATARSGPRSCASHRLGR